MKPETAEWVAKAEADWQSAGVVFRARRTPNLDLACFLCQQCAEKYLKARLTEAAHSFPRTHDLLTLIGLCKPFEPQWELLREPAARLTEYAVAFRYPGSSADRARTKAALADGQLMRDAVRLALKLPEQAARRRSPARKTVKRGSKPRKKK